MHKTYRAPTQWRDSGTKRERVESENDMKLPIKTLPLLAALTIALILGQQALITQSASSRENSAHTLSPERMQEIDRVLGAYINGTPGRINESFDFLSKTRGAEQIYVLSRIFAIAHLQGSGGRITRAKKLMDEFGAEAYLMARSELTFTNAPVNYKNEGPDAKMRDYWVQVPTAYDSSKSYPLLISMHGGVSGAPEGSGEGNIGLYQSYLESEGWADKLFILSPDARADGQEGTLDVSEMWWGNTGISYVLDMLKETKERYNIDDDRVFITGFSDGGSGSFAFAARRPNAFAGFFPLSGNPLVPELTGVPMFGENLKGQKIYAVNGGKDRLYPGEEIRKVIENGFNASGANIQFKVYPDAEHRPSYFPQEMPIILNELIGSWKRDLLPTEIDWSLFEEENGSRAWVEVTDTFDMEMLNRVGPANRAERTPRERRVRLGITPKQGVEPITIDTVQDKSLAARMGLQVGDQIKSINGEPAGTRSQIVEALDKLKFGGQISIVVKRDGFEVTISGVINDPAEEEEDESDAPLEARLIATRSAGKIDIQSSNVLTLKIHVAPEMLAEDGSLTIMVNGAEAYSDKPAPDMEYLREAWNSNRDRKWPFVTAIEIDLDEVDIKEGKANPMGVEE